jgi:hypothetical protein
MLCWLVGLVRMFFRENSNSKFHVAFVRRYLIILGCHLQHAAQFLCGEFDAAYLPELDSIIYASDPVYIAH